ncbi:MAG: TIGR03768 family metallophosphoesterase [Pseudodesulfovibrio sp.]|nr:TIGR03768 family metallophosphoesterase [Pseudodesulfovibrio sp.]
MSKKNINKNPMVSLEEEHRALNVDGEARQDTDLTRRKFIQYSTALLAGVILPIPLVGCASKDTHWANFDLPRYEIDTVVQTTEERMIAFNMNLAEDPKDPKNLPLAPDGKSEALAMKELHRVSEYQDRGYGLWSYGSGLPIVPRTDIMPIGYLPPDIEKRTSMLNFFAMTDIHLTDKEAPNQFIHNQQEDSSCNNTSIYSPVMMYTPHVFDAAIQTVNALHEKKNYDFGISLGDVSNTAMYKELRWYIDILDGEKIRPSSGAHVGENTIDYQKPFQAAGLNKDIPFYQALGNHDHFLIGSFPIFEDYSKLGLEDSFTDNKVWTVTDFLKPDLTTFPALFDTNTLQKRNGKDRYFGGIIDGSTENGDIVYDDGPIGKGSKTHKIIPDVDRRPLKRTEWIEEFFTTSSTPEGHGFNRVKKSFGLPEKRPNGFACYSFQPESKSNPELKVPVKIIVLDNTQREDDGSRDIHGHGFLDPLRWKWLKKELKEGQRKNQLMVIAAHIPICVAGIGTELEWWTGGKTKANPFGDPTTETQNGCTISELVGVLRNTPNLLMWIAGHRHFNTVKAIKSDNAAKPERSFWQVETSSLRDFPQQFRNFEIFFNDDDTISIDVVNVDPAVKKGTPAETSRKYAIATQQIVQNTLLPNFQNTKDIVGANIPSMDPSRPQDNKEDPSIQPPIDLSLAEMPVQYHASYNARLSNSLTKTMVGVLKNIYHKK